MRSKLLMASANSSVSVSTPDVIRHKPSFENCVEQAEICCEQARLAARCRRYRAACGLFDTASALYQRALSVDGITYPALKNRLLDIEMEKLTYAELAKSMARPLTKKQEA